MMHCTGNAKVVGSNPVRQSLNFFQVIFPVVLWLHSHLSFFHYLLLLDTFYYKVTVSQGKTEKLYSPSKIKLSRVLRFTNKIYVKYEQPLE